MNTVNYKAGTKAEVEALAKSLTDLLQNIHDHPHGDLILRALHTILQTSTQETERLDWKLIAGSLQDMQKAIAVFHPYRHIRKVSIFGSARSSPQDLEYQQAKEFAECITRDRKSVV